MKRHTYYGCYLDAPYFKWTPCFICNIDLQIKYLDTVFQRITHLDALFTIPDLKGQYRHDQQGMESELD